MDHSDTSRPHMSPLECAHFSAAVGSTLRAAVVTAPPFYKLGRLVKYITEVVEEWAKARLVRSFSETFGQNASR